MHARRIRFTVPQNLTDLRLDRAVHHALSEQGISCSIGHTRDLIHLGAVYIGKRRVRHSKQILKPDQNLQIYFHATLPDPAPDLMEGDILFHDKHLIAVAKPAKLPTQGTIDNDRDHLYALVKRYMVRPAEQLYHTAKDTYEMKDLARDPGHAAIKARLAAELDRWMKAQGDPGAPQDTRKALQASRQGKHLYAPPTAR